MDGKTYQQLAMRTALTNGLEPDRDTALIISSMGLSGEAGEFTDHIKKHLFHGHNLDTEHCIKELGDLLWYIARACEALGTDLDAVMEQNIRKLEQRYPQGFSEENSRNRTES